MTNREAIKWLNNLMTSIGEPQYSSLWHYIQPLTKINDMLLLLPSAQTEIVRCKDCKRWDGVPADETQDHECHLFDGNEEKIRIATPSYWFCPMGKRRTDDVPKTD